MAEHKEWVVELVVTTEHQYNVLARTPEEAISNAEDLLDSGDDGNIVSMSVDNADAISVDAYVDPEDFDGEPAVWEEEVIFES